jgi:hypothetical protein
MKAADIIVLKQLLHDQEALHVSKLMFLSNFVVAKKLNKSNFVKNKLINVPVQFKCLRLSLLIINI